jgi:hypothetical protein
MKLICFLGLISACSGKAIVDGPPGSGGASGGGGASSNASSSTTNPTSSVTGTPCVDAQHCKHCASCLMGPSCGRPGQLTETVCHCNKGPQSMTSEQLWTAAYSCVCGADGKSGKCGAACPKSCRDTGMDAPFCKECFGEAIGSICKAQLKACLDDK